MVPSFALVLALFVSQAEAAETPEFDQKLACNTWAGGCTCAAIGAMDNTSNSNTNCSGSTAHMDHCRTACCGDPAVPTCYSVWAKNMKMCDGGGLEIDYSKFTMPAGASAERRTNCCRTKPIVKCSQVQCSVQGVSGRRRRDVPQGHAGAYKAKAGMAETICTSVEDCENKCCEKNTLMCGGVSSSDAAKWCGANYSATPLVSTGAAPTCGSVATAAMVAPFVVKSDNTSFRSACCTAKPTKTACAADFSCPEHYKRKSSMPTTLYHTPKYYHCCDMKANVTQCSDHCTAGTTKIYMFPRAANSCHASGKQGCDSSKCGTGQALDRSLRIANGATASNATIKSTCCFNKPTTSTPSTLVNAKCSAFFAAAAAGAKGTSAANRQQTFLPILAVALFTFMKF